MSSYLLYLELNGICLLLLLWVLVTLRKNEGLHTRNVVLYREVSLTMFVLLIDMLWLAIEGKPGAVFHHMNLVLNVLYYSLGALTFVGWLLFALYLYKPHLCTNKIIISILMFPDLLITLAAISSPWTHWIFSVDMKNVVRQGRYCFLVQSVIFAYYLVAFVISVYSMLKRGYLIKSLRRIPVTFPCMLILFAASIILFVTRSFDSLWPVFSVMLVLVYADIQFERISLDSLTGLNNRSYFDKRISIATSSPAPVGKDLYLFLMDIDFFKKINDSYGHLEGDAAIKKTADILRAVCSEEHAVISRYGGDEFACIYYCAGDREADALKEKILNAFEERNRNSNEAFPINVSVGYAMFGESGVYNDIELINRADEELYKVKQIAHRGKRGR